MKTFLFLVFFIGIQLEQNSASADLCESTVTSIGVVYELAPNDFVVIADIAFEGTNGVDILLTLNNDKLKKYFGILPNDNTLVVSNSSALNRGEISPSGYIITGIISCETVVPPIVSVTGNVEVTFFYTNNFDPEFISVNETSVSEVTAVGATVLQLQIQDQDNDETQTPTYSIVSQYPSGYFELSGSILKIKKALDYNSHTSHTIEVRVMDEGFNEIGGANDRTATQTITVEVIDYDNLPPNFAKCEVISGVCVPPLYTVNISKNEVDSDLDSKIQPGAISAKDGDTGINSPIEYSFITGVPANYGDYFEIDPTTGTVSQTREVPSISMFNIGVKATQKDNPSQFAFTYLQISVTEKDDFKPEFAEPSYSGEIVDNGEPFLFVYVTGTEDLLQVVAKDDDNDTQTSLVYVVDPPYEITSDGNIFVQSSALITRAAPPSTLTVRAININSQSENRQSDPVTVSVAYIEVTTPNPTTTEMPTTTVEDTTAALDSTTVFETTSITNPTTTAAETTMSSSTAEESTTAEVTTQNPTTVPPSTSIEATTNTPVSTAGTSTDFTMSTVTVSLPSEVTSDAITQSISDTSSVGDSSTANTADFASSATQSDQTGTTVAETQSTSSEATTKELIPATTTSGNQNSPSTTGSEEIIDLDNMVSSSLLYGVAGGLSAALFIAICIIIYLIYRQKNMKLEDKEPLVNPYPKKNDKSSSSGSITHENGAYEEIDETRSNDGDDPKVKTVGFVGATIVPDLNDASSDRSENSYSGSEYHHYESDNGVDLSTEFEKHESESDYDRTDNNSLSNGHIFQDELAKKAALVTANIAIAAQLKENDVEEKKSDQKGIMELSDDVIEVEAIIKDGLVSSTKIVTLKGLGDDGNDIKAVLKSLNTDMATSYDIHNWKEKLLVMGMLSELDHPNILKCYGQYEKDDCFHVAMAYAEYGSLKDFVKGHNELNANRLMHIIAGIGRGLQYLHAKNIVHGNLQANSVMLDASYIPMLTDIENTEVIQTDVGDRIRWQALEVIDGLEKSTATSDVWSFGVLIWEIVSLGAVPYADVPSNMLAQHIKTSKLEKPEGCSETLYKVMESCWNEKETRLRPDIYEINTKISELLEEDSNDLIRMGFGESSVGDELPGFSVDEQNSENSTPWKRSSLSISESSDVNTDYTAL